MRLPKDYVMAAERQTRIDSIQALRATAAIAVVFGHAQGLLVRFKVTYGIDDAWLNLVDPVKTGQCGVDIFFVISGFIMALVTNDMHNRKGAILDFAQKRLIRIFPPYWLWTFVLLFLLLFFPQHFSSGRTFELREAILSLLLIPYAPSGANTSPILQVGWTLSYEMYFYALVCIGLFFSRKKFIVGLGIFFFITTVIFTQRHSPVSNLTTDTILWEFYAGVLLFELYKSGKSLSIILSICIVIPAIIAFYYFAKEAPSYPRFIYWGLPALAFVSSCIFFAKEATCCIPKTFIFLGDSSYTIYLSHFIILPIAGKISVIVGLHMILPPDVQIILYTAICTVLGCILYVITERPMLDYFRNKRVTLYP